MSDKPYPPSPKKLQKARKEGKVAQSNELVASLVFLAAILFLWGVHSLFNRGLKQVFLNIYSEFNSITIGSAFGLAFSPIVWPLAALLGSLFLITVAAYLLQRGWIWSFEPLKPKWRRPRAEFLPLLKGAVIAGVGYLVLRSKKPTTELIFSSSFQKVTLLFKQIFFLTLEVGLALLVLGVIDFVYRKWRFRQENRMTPQELKEEKREEEASKNKRKF